MGPGVRKKIEDMSRPTALQIRQVTGKSIEGRECMNNCHMAFIAGADAHNRIVEEKMRAVLLYAYEDSNDQYYLNVLEELFGPIKNNDEGSPT